MLQQNRTCHIDAHSAATKFTLVTSSMNTILNTHTRKVASIDNEHFALRTSHCTDAWSIKAKQKAFQTWHVIKADDQSPYKFERFLQVMGPAAGAKPFNIQSHKTKRIHIYVYVSREKTKDNETI